MDGLGRTIGDGIGGLFSGAIAAFGNAVSGVGSALSTALPAGALPVLAVVVGLGLLWLIFKR
jgi:hypothetical protein